MLEVRALDFPGIVDMLRFFVKTRRYGIVDRLGFAQSPDAVRQAIYEALRTVKASKDNAVRIKLKVGGKEGEAKEYTVTCLELEAAEEAGSCDFRGVLVEVLEGSPGRLSKGQIVCCVRDVKLPSEEELERFFSILKKDPEQGMALAREIASLAFAFQSSRG